MRKKGVDRSYLSTLIEKIDLSCSAKTRSRDALRRSRWHFLQYSAYEKLLVLQSGQITVLNSFRFGVPGGINFVP
jgi:hypothetical protein